MIDIKQQKGFSIIELMISLCIISIGLVSLSSFQARLFTDSNLAKEKSEAITLAKSQLELLRYQLISGKNTPIDQYRLNKPKPPYSLKYDITDVSQLSHLQTISVTVEWIDSRGRQQTVKLESALTPDTANQLTNILTSAEAYYQTN